jgi:hypothetical protein
MTPPFSKKKIKSLPSIKEVHLLNDKNTSRPDFIGYNKF